MMKFRKVLLAGSLCVVGGAAALAAGLYTNGFPTVSAPTVNGATIVAPSGVVTELTSKMLYPVDTQLASGQAPQTVAATAFQGAALAAEIAANAATSTVHAATLNTVAGTITTEALSTAAGATYTFTLTNSLLVAGAPAPQVAMYSGTNTGGVITLTSVTNATGSSVFVFTNTGATAFNGTMVIAFHI